MAGDTGQPEREVPRAYRKVGVAHAHRLARKSINQVAAMPRSRIMGGTRGLMKFVIDTDTDRIPGAALLSIDAQELINTVHGPLPPPEAPVAGRTSSVWAVDAAG